MIPNAYLHTPKISLRQAWQEKNVGLMAFISGVLGALIWVANCIFA